MINIMSDSRNLHATFSPISGSMSHTNVDKVTPHVADPSWLILKFDDQRYDTYITPDRLTDMYTANWYKTVQEKMLW